MSVYICGCVGVCVSMGVCAPVCAFVFSDLWCICIKYLSYDTSWQLWLSGYIFCSMCAIDVNTIFYPMFIFVLTLICFYCRMFIDLQLESGYKKKSNIKLETNPSPAC